MLDTHRRCAAGLVTRDSALSEWFGESWRIAPEGRPPTARRCSCPEPLVEHDADDWTLCLICGREPSIRPPAPLGASESAPNGSNGRPACDPTPQLTHGGSVRDDEDNSKTLSMTDRKHIGFQAPRDLAVALQEEAARHDRSVSAELRRMVRAHLAENRSARPDQPDASRTRALSQPANES